jgi:hypothetical protein
MSYLGLLVLLLGLLYAVQEKGLQLVAPPQLSRICCAQLPHLLALTLECFLQLLDDVLTGLLLPLLRQQAIACCVIAYKQTETHAYVQHGLLARCDAC